MAAKKTTQEPAQDTGPEKHVHEGRPDDVKATLPAGAGADVLAAMQETAHSIPKVDTSGMPPMPDLDDPEAHPQAPEKAQPPAQAQDRTLAVLDVEITQELTLALTDDRNRIRHYANAGRLYKEAQAQADKEGVTFEEWFDSRDRHHSIRTARHWMALWTHWDAVEPMLMNMNPGSQPNYKDLVADARKQKAKGKKGKKGRKGRSKWALDFARVENRLVALKQKHHNFKTAQDIFDFLKELHLPQKVWKTLE